MINIFIND